MVNEHFTRGNCVSVCDQNFARQISCVEYNIDGYIKKNKESAHDFNVVIRKGVLLPTVRQPITKLQLTKNLVYHQGHN